MAKWVALLRGINVGGGNRLPMAELRALCDALGWTKVETYIGSGNIVFEAAAEPAALEAALEAAIGRASGLRIPVIARSAMQWRVYAPSNPFPDAAELEPNRLMLMLAKQPLLAGAAAALAERARDGERIEQTADALWVHYPAGAGTSRLSPAWFDRLAGSPVTARNYRTVLKLQEMLGR